MAHLADAAWELTVVWNPLSSFYWGSLASFVFTTIPALLYVAHLMRGQEMKGRAVRETQARSCVRQSALLYRELNRDFPDLHVVAKRVRRGANIAYKPNAEDGDDEGSERYPALHSALRAGNVAAVLILLQTKEVVDFTVMDDYDGGWNALHYCTEDWHVIKRRTKKTMLDAILARLRTHPEDRVDWTQRNSFGHDCCSIAAAPRLCQYMTPFSLPLPCSSSVSSSPLRSSPVSLSSAARWAAAGAAEDACASQSDVKIKSK